MSNGLNTSLSDRDKAAIEIFKHYSSIRFLMLPMFFTSTGAVAAAYWTIASHSGASNGLARWVTLAGAFLSLFFTVYEYRLSDTLLRVSSLLPESMAPLKHKKYLGLVTISTLLLYGMPIFFWLWCLFQRD